MASGLFALSEAEGCVSRFNDRAVMRNPVQERNCHRGIGNTGLYRLIPPFLARTSFSLQSALIAEGQKGLDG